MSSYPQDPVPSSPEAAPGPAPTANAESEARVAARKRIEARRGLVNHAIVYLVVNSFFVAVWWFTGAGYFWPAWVIGGWGIGLALNAWEVLFSRPITDADIDREMQRGG
jgi:hypothetical protein